MLTDIKKFAVPGLSIISGVFLLWTIAFPDVHSPAGGWITLGPPDPSAIFPLDAPTLVSWNESIHKWMNASTPKRSLIERPIFTVPPYTYSTHGDGKVVVLMGLTKSSQDLFSGVQNFHQKVFYNRLDYVNHQGYEFMSVDLMDYAVSEKYSPVWAKFYAIMDAFEKFPKSEWVWWLDLDAIILTPQVDVYSLFLESSAMKGMLHENETLGMGSLPAAERHRAYSGTNLNPEEIDVIIAQDQNGINAGSAFFRNSETMKLMAEFWEDKILVKYASKQYQLQEQDLILHTMLEHPHLRQRIGIVKQGLFNAYVDEDEAQRWDAWEEGRVVVHFPACKFVKNMCSNRFNDWWLKRAPIRPWPIETWE